jgi:hypothetical protein
MSSFLFRGSTPEDILWTAEFSKGPQGPKTCFHSQPLLDDSPHRFRIAARMEGFAKLLDLARFK